MTTTKPLALHFDPAGDPLGALALEQLTERACESHAIALHYREPDTTATEAAREAMSNALERVAADPELGLTERQRQRVCDLAAQLDLAVVEDLTGANGDGVSADVETSLPS